MKLVLLKTGQVAMAAFITIVLLLTSALNDVHSTCETPQFVEYGRDVPLKCKFEKDTVGLYWYELINSTYELQIKLDAVGGSIAISGPGYLDGNFDILDDGSLMIFNVTNYNTRNFKAVHVNTNYLVTENFVELVTSILSHQKFPSVSVCDGDNVCFVDSNEVSNLTCTFHQNRPAVEMAWYRQSHEGVELIRQHPSISKDGKWTFSSVLNLDVTNLINGPLIAFICRVSSPALNAVTLESTAVIYSDESKWQSLVQANRTETFHLINTSAELCCSKTGRKQLLLWQELRGDYWEARVLYINGMKKYLSNFTSDWKISPEGSIVVDRMKFASQGSYTCVSTNERQYYSMENEVTIHVPPNPPFFVADGCPLENKHCSISLQAEDTLFSISCIVKGVYPKLGLGMEGNYFSNDTDVITQVKRARDGQTYDVMAKVLLHPQECGMVQNVTCFTKGPKQLHIVPHKTISIQTACVTKHLKPVAVILPVTAVLISICLVLLYIRSKKQKQQNFPEDADNTEKNDGTHVSKESIRFDVEKDADNTEINDGTHVSKESIRFDVEKEDEDQPENVLTLRKDEDELEYTEQPLQPMEMDNECSDVSEISESTHLLEEEADTSTEDNTQLHVLRDGKSKLPFDEEVIKILKNEEIKFGSYKLFQDKKKWERVKTALKNVTAWYKNFELTIVLYHVTSHLKKEIWDSLIPSEVENFQHGVQDLISSVEKDSLNDIGNFRRRAEILVKEFEQINLTLMKVISETQWKTYLEFLKGERNVDKMEMLESCLVKMLSEQTVSSFARLIEILFLADIVNNKGTICVVTASTGKTTGKRVEERLDQVMKGIDVARIALSAGKAYVDSEGQMDRHIKIEEKLQSTSLSLKDTADLMERINLAIQKSNQNQ